MLIYDYNLYPFNQHSAIFLRLVFGTDGVQAIELTIGRRRGVEGGDG